MRRAAVLALVPLAAALLAACGPTGEPDVRVGRAQAAVPVAGASQIVLALSNEGDGPDEVVGATTPVAAGVEIHVTEIVDGAARMRALESVELPAGGTVRFRPGELHLMLIGPDASVVEGATFDLTLEFSRSPALTVPVEVVEAPELDAGRSGRLVSG